MSKDYRYLYGFSKKAAAVLTPEAEQAAIQPPMPPAGGMPMDPSMAGGMPPQGAPMDPSMMGGAPAAPMGGMPMDPAAMGGAPGGMPMGGAPMGGAPMGGQLPPEIMQDQMFMQFLAEALGIQMDPNSGTFIDPQGQPIPPDMLIQIYQQFQQQMMATQQGGAGAPMDPSMMGVDPAAMGMDPSMTGGMPPDAGGGIPEEVITQISSSVVSGVEAVLQDLTAATERKISALMEEVKTLKSAIDMLTDTTDKRTKSEMDVAAQLRDEIAADLMPQQTAPVQKAASIEPLKMSTAGNQAQPAMPGLFEIISGKVK